MNRSYENSRFALLTLSVLSALSGFATLRCNAAIYQSDGSASSVKALHKTARDGDTITLPAGTFTWSESVTITKAIKIEGAGSGRILGNTKSEITIGTGSKTFTSTRAIPGVVAGQTLRIAKMPTHNGPARENYVEGTVTSYSGTTLVLNVTNTGGSGTYKFWFIATQPKTTIVNDYSNGNRPNRALIDTQQTTAGSAEFSGIHFLANPATTNRSTFIKLESSTYMNPKTLIHDCWFQTDGGGLSAIFAETNQELIYNCSFDDTFSQAAGAFTLKWENDAGRRSWTSNSTMGADDTNGATNSYIEDCDFHAYLIATDFDSNARTVFRHNRLDNSGMGSHGADGSLYGLRHYEIYDNELIFDNFGDCDGSVTLNVNWFFWQRGGTGVITDNILPAISSCAWGNKGNVLFSVLNIARSIGCYPCWIGYPAPHQIGQGYGPGAVLHSWSCPKVMSDGSYYTYSEPVYIWNNSGTAGNKVDLNAESDGPCKTNEALTTYVRPGRDYKLEPKPGYVKYAYPHPLRNSSAHSTPTSSARSNTAQKAPQRYREKNKKGWGELKRKNEQKPNEEPSNQPAEHQDEASN